MQIVATNEKNRPWIIQNGNHRGKNKETSLLVHLLW